MRITDSVSLFFLFQAEDGIRDLTVTGVQTCALPIYYFEVQFPLVVVQLGLFSHPMAFYRLVALVYNFTVILHLFCRLTWLELIAILPGEIGRASCRERV